MVYQVMDGRSAIRRGTLRSTTSTSSSTRTPTPTQTTVPVNIGSIGDPLSSHSSLDGSDPLTQFVREEMDPLSKMACDEVKFEIRDIIDKTSTCSIF